jgi:hypothetical protein
VGVQVPPGAPIYKNFQPLAGLGKIVQGNAVCKDCNLASSCSGSV